MEGFVSAALEMTMVLVAVVLSNRRGPIALTNFKMESDWTLSERKRARIW